MERIADVVAAMEQIERSLDQSDARRYFHGTYLRITRAVAAAIDRGAFLDPAWTERWDVAFARRYLDAMVQWESGTPVPLPWQVAFDATTGPRMAPLRHVLLGINAHVNYDLPQALLDVIDDAEFRDPTLLERRAADHRRIDAVLAGRVAAEDGELAKVELPGDRDWFDRAGRPFNRFGVKVFVREARRKVWSNARLLSEARGSGPEALARQLALLERASAARVSDLIRPKRVILELAVRGFGVELQAGAP